jgi:hypothetical protein
MHHALISCAIKLLLSETGGEAALYGVQGERTRRAADVDRHRQGDHRCPANTSVRLRKLVFHENNER